MYNNYNGGYKRSGGSYKSSKYNRRKLRSRRTRNRIIIVSIGVLAFALIVLIIASMFNCMCNGCSGEGNTIDTSTVNTNETEAKNTKSSKNNKKNEQSELTFVTPDIEDEDESATGYMSNGLYVYNNAAFELFSGSDDAAKTYAELMNTVKKKLGKNISVYSMIIPNHTEMGLPSRLKNTDDGVSTSSQADYIKASYKAMSDDVIKVNCYNALAEHCNEYIYFDSDHHWTGLGAYYAYTAFTDATNQKAIKLKNCEQHSIEGFTGSFVTMLGTDAGLSTDTVNYWTFSYDVPTTITNSNGETNDYSSCYYLNEGSGSNSYGVFLWGDNPLEVIKSECKSASDDKILIVHESYGNALVPYFTYNYKEVHSIDFRSWSGDLSDYCEQNDITTVLFANGVMSSATATQIDAIQGLVD